MCFRTKEKTMGDNLDTRLLAERGFIYKWQNPHSLNEHYNYALVVSSNARSMDNLISILFLSTMRTSGHGNDMVPVKVNGEKMCVHADLVTYTKREYLVQKMGPVSEEVMQKVELRMASSLDLERRDMMYEELYNDLVHRMVTS